MELEKQKYSEHTQAQESEVVVTKSRWFAPLFFTLFLFNLVVSLNPIDYSQVTTEPATEPTYATTNLQSIISTQKAIGFKSASSKSAKLKQFVGQNLHHHKGTFHRVRVIVARAEIIFIAKAVEYINRPTAIPRSISNSITQPPKI